MNVRFFLAACAVAASLSHPTAGRAEAVDPEARALAQQLMDATITGELVQSVVAQSWPPMQAVIQQSAPAIRNDQMLAFKAEYVRLMNEEMKSEMADTPDIYAKYFSLQELKDMMAFYETDTGKKTLAVMPAMMGEMMQKSAARMPGMMQNLMTRFREVLQQKGIKL